MNIQKKEAFTLVELIVVITILAILGTIAFISFQGYSRSARNSRRISDVSNIKISLALFNTRTGRYPEPENFINITYLGAMVRSEGIMGETVVRQLKELPKVPLDPLLDVEYAYSLLNTKKEYEVGTIVEGQSGIIGYLDKKIINNIYADSNTNFAYIKGTYNGIVAKVSTGGTEYALAVPTIIGADLTDPNYENLVDNKLLSYDGFQNLPSSYSGTNLTMTGGFDFGGNSDNIVLYTGSIEDLSDSSSELKIFGDNLQTAYTGTDLSFLSQYSQILSMNTSDINELNSVAGNIVNNYLGGNVAAAPASNFVATLTKTLASNAGSTAYEAGDVITITLNGITQTYTLIPADVANDDNVLLTSIKSSIDGNPSMSALVSTVVTDKNTLTLTSKNSGTTFTASAEITTDFSSDGTDTIVSSTTPSTYSCNDSTKPADNGHITYTVGTPTIANQTYIQNATNCGYSCTDGYSGSDCGVLPSINTSCTGINTPAPFFATTTYFGCNTADIIVCSGNQTGYTMSSCNIGTTISGTGETSYGYYFQWGNNYGSIGTGPTTTTLVNASSYGPGNYYTSTSFIIGSTDWSTVQNDNLWGNTTNTNIARQGPCATGYHVPSQIEWNGVVTAGQWGTNGINMSNILKLPMAGWRSRSSGILGYQGDFGFYRSSSPGIVTSTYTHALKIGEDEITLGDFGRAIGYSVRCFKN